MRIALTTGICAVAFAAARPSLAAEPPSWDAVWWTRVHESRLKPADGQPLPFTGAGRARYQKTIVDLKSGAVVDNAAYLCLSQGMPRAMSSAFPFQIVITPGQVTFLYEENRAYRIVNIASRRADPAVWDPSYMGDAIARWSDDHGLVIDSTNFKSEKMYLDATGVPVSDKLHLVERFSLKNGGTELEDLITIDDPVIFTRTWTARRTYARRDDTELQTDWVCGEKHRDVSAVAGAVAK